MVRQPDFGISDVLTFGEVVESQAMTAGKHSSIWFWLLTRPSTALIYTDYIDELMEEAPHLGRNIIESCRSIVVCAANDDLLTLSGLIQARVDSHRAEHEANGTECGAPHIGEILEKWASAMATDFGDKEQAERMAFDRDEPEVAAQLQGAYPVFENVGISGVEGVRPTPHQIRVGEAALQVVLRKYGLMRHSDTKMADVGGSGVVEVMGSITRDRIASEFGEVLSDDDVLSKTVQSWGDQFK